MPRYALQVSVDGGFVGREFDPEEEIIDAYSEAVRQYELDPAGPPDVVALVLVPVGFDPAIDPAANPAALVDWKYEVANGDTVLGLADWIDAQNAANAE